MTADAEPPRRYAKHWGVRSHPRHVTVAAVAGAVIAARLRRSPLFGLPVGVAGYLAMIPIGWIIAQQV